MKSTLRRIAESAMLIAIGTVLSLFKFEWALGGGITVCSMLPLIMITQRYGTKWGILSSLVYGTIQMFLGMSYVQCATTFWSAAGIVFLDYILAYTIIGFSACFNKVVSDRRKAIVLGISITFFGRFLCHFLSGIIIWNGLFPNELGWASPLWSLAYNGSYMLPEIIITSIVAFLSFKPLKRFWLCEDIVR